MDLMYQEIQEGNIEGVKNLLNEPGFNFYSDWKDYYLLRTALRYRQKQIAKLFLKKGARCRRLARSFDEELRDDTPLHLAVSLGCSDIFEILLHKGALLYAKNMNNETPLISAAIMGKHPMVDRLLSLISTGKNNRCKNGLSHFHIACMRNHVEMVKTFLQRGVNINDSVDSESCYWPGYTALHFAVKYQCLETAELLVNCGANITAKNVNALTALHLAFRNQNQSMIDLILSGHSYITENPVNSEGLSHFHIACTTRNNPGIVHSFLKSGVDIDMTLNNKKLAYREYTPLSFAIEYECIDVIKILLLYNPYEEDIMSRTSNVSIIKLFHSKFKREEMKDMVSNLELSKLHVACINNNVTDIRKLLNNNALINSRINSDSPSWLSYTPLHLAVCGEHLDIIRLLIDSDADMTAKDARAKTPLHLAFENKNNKIVDLILSVYPNVNYNPMDNKGLSHFHVACARGNLSVIKQFVRNRVDINHQVNFESVFWPGYTALHFACHFRHTKVIELLLSQDANITLYNGLGTTPLELMFEKADPNRAHDLQLVEVINVILSTPGDKYSDFCANSGLSL